MRNTTKSQWRCIKRRDYFEDAGIDKKIIIMWLNDVLTNGLKITVPMLLTFIPHCSATIYAFNFHSPCTSNWLTLTNLPVQDILAYNLEYYEKNAEVIHFTRAQHIQRWVPTRVI
jgi:hypothetical protein